MVTHAISVRRKLVFLKQSYIDRQSRVSNWQVFSSLQGTRFQQHLLSRAHWCVPRLSAHVQACDTHHHCDDLRGIPVFGSRAQAANSFLGFLKSSSTNQEPR
jgi:hypothetical protein